MRVTFISYTAAHKNEILNLSFVELNSQADYGLDIYFLRKREKKRWPKL